MMRSCLAFRHCLTEAEAYYGTRNEEKALCASWKESTVFGDPKIMAVDSGSAKRDKIFEHHQKALYKIQINRRKHKMCQKYVLFQADCSLMI